MRAGEHSKLNKLRKKTIVCRWGAWLSHRLPNSLNKTELYKKLLVNFIFLQI
jgi:hypothetical protein